MASRFERATQLIDAFKNRSTGSAFPYLKRAEYAKDCAIESTTRV